MGYQYLLFVISRLSDSALTMPVIAGHVMSIQHASIVHEASLVYLFQVVPVRSSTLTPTMPKAKQPKPTNPSKKGSNPVGLAKQSATQDGDSLLWPKVSPKKGLSVDCIIKDQIYVIDVSTAFFIIRTLHRIPQSQRHPD